MKKYISIKEVQAEPMNELQAVELGYARPNEDNHEWREGYHVVYPDGYHSWCPKNIFEKSNQPAETVLDRLKIEYGELHVRLRKLEDFRYSPKYIELPEDQQQMLYAQYAIMDAYHTILIARIESLDNKELPDFPDKPIFNSAPCCNPDGEPCCEPCSEPCYEENHKQA